MDTVEMFISESGKIHDNKYDYSMVRGSSIDDYPDVLFILSHDEVCIICAKHGKFWQMATNHKNAENRCAKCYGNALSNTEQFILQARKVHGDRYGYSEIKYINKRMDIFIICPQHKGFWQNAGHHLNGSGCPACLQSKGENEIGRILKKLNIRFRSQKKFGACRSPFTGNKLKFDFWLWEYQILIEFQGRQHFKPIEYFGGTIGFLKCKLHDYAKRKFAKKRDFALLEPDYKIKHSDLERWLLTRLNIQRQERKVIDSSGKLKPDTIGTQTSIFDLFKKQ